MTRASHLGAVALTSWILVRMNQYEWGVRIWHPRDKLERPLWRWWRPCVRSTSHGEFM